MASSIQRRDYKHNKREMLVKNDGKREHEKEKDTETERKRETEREKQTE